MRKDWVRPPIIDNVPKDKKRVVLSLSYDGTNFVGWQSQENKNTVEDALEDAIFKLCKQKVKVYGSGRTDTGVHAICQVCHFDIDTNIPEERFSYALNSYLNKSIKIMSAKFTTSLFHSRFSALAREYRYYIKEEKYTYPFERNYVWSLNKLPSIQVLNNLSLLIKGERDFKFLTPPSYQFGTKRDIYKSSWDINKNMLCYTIVGNAFIYHMVRNLVGTMIKVSLQHKDKADDEFRQIINSTTYSNRLYTAPSCGLYFYKTIYNEDEWYKISREIENGK